MSRRHKAKAPEFRWTTPEGFRLEQESVTDFDRQAIERKRLEADRAESEARQETFDALNAQRINAGMEPIEKGME